MLGVVSSLGVNHVIHVDSVPQASWSNQAMSGMELSLKLVQFRVNPRVGTETLEKFFLAELRLGGYRSNVIDSHTDTTWKLNEATTQ